MNKKLKEISHYAAIKLDELDGLDRYNESKKKKWSTVVPKVGNECLLRSAEIVALTIDKIQGQIELLSTMLIS